MTKHLHADRRVPIDTDNFAIERIEEKCVLCGLCKTVCRDYIGVEGRYDLAKTGDRAICINCGQCANVCPVDSIVEKSEVAAVEAALADPEVTVVFSTSPSVRVGLGEAFGLTDGTFVEGRMVALLRALGANYVLDTNFAADLTIVEEASELVERIVKKTAPLPQFTSCCPAWVRYAELFHPEVLPHISSAKSPIGMQGPVVKSYFAEKKGLDPKKIFHVAVTPCTAKKYEIRRPEMNAAGRRIEELLQKEGIEAALQFDPTLSTTEKLRIVARQQQMLRCDFESHPDAEALLHHLDLFNRHLEKADALVLSDYGKGGLTHITKMIECARAKGCPVLVDPKGDDYERYRGATVITPNRSELRQVVGAWKSEADLLERAQNLRAELDLQYLLLTRSEEGMTLFSDEGAMTVPAQAREVFDVSGAGDTVIAVLATLVAAGVPIPDAVATANRAGGIVVGKLGTASVTYEELFS